MLKEKALNWIDKHQKRSIELSDEILDLAELGLQEFKSSTLPTNFHLLLRKVSGNQSKPFVSTFYA